MAVISGSGRWWGVHLDHCRSLGSEGSRGNRPWRAFGIGLSEKECVRGGREEGLHVYKYLPVLHLC